MLMILIVFSLIILSNELFHYQIRECFISKNLLLSLQLLLMSCVKSAITISFFGIISLRKTINNVSDDFFQCTNLRYEKSVAMLSGKEIF